MAVREELAARWLATQRRVSEAGVKRVCYLSVEFLLGRFDQRAGEPGRRPGGGSSRGVGRDGPRPGPDRRGGDRPRSGQRRPGPPRRLLSRFTRHPAVSGGRLRHPLRLRDLHPDDRRGWPPARNRKQLASSLQPVGDSRDDASDPLRRPPPQDAQGIKRTRWAETCQHLGGCLRPADSATAARPSITCGSGPVARSPRSMSRHSTPGATPTLPPRRRTPRASRGCCTRTTRRRRARSCASSSSTSS